MRPCLTLDFGALAADIKAKTLDVNAMANATMITQEYAINNMFLPGQIENWVVIVDLAH